MDKVNSKWAFNILYDGVIRQVSEKAVNEKRWWERKGVDDEKTLYADDTAMMTESREDLQHIVGVFGSACKRMSLKINDDKGTVQVIGEFQREYGECESEWEKTGRDGEI